MPTYFSVSITDLSLRRGVRLCGHLRLSFGNRRLASSLRRGLALTPPLGRRWLVVGHTPHVEDVVVGVVRLIPADGGKKQVPK